jgi:DNA-directed RNA polymerase subunit RPC12/RpoP
VGCGELIPWDGHGLFAYECRCGAKIFMNEGGEMAFPVSFVRALAEQREIPHIDYYLGISNHTSETKEKLVSLLKGLGAVWSWECPECRGKITERVWWGLRLGELRLEELHPGLRTLVEGVVR